MPRTLLCLCVLFSACGKKSARTGDDQTPGVATIVPSTNEPKNVAPLRPALPAGWIEFTQPEGAFTVFLPGPAYPDRMNNDLRQQVPIGQMRTAEYQCQASGLICKVGVKIYSPELVAANRTHSETCPLPAGWKRTAVSWLRCPAFDVTYEDFEGRGATIYRVAWIGNREYHCSVSGRPTTTELAALFDSFATAK